MNPSYVRELGELGYRGLDMKMLVALRSQGVNPDYVRELKELGYGGLAPGQLIELRAQGVTPSYVRELKEAGFEKLTVEELDAAPQPGRLAATAQEPARAQAVQPVVVGRKGARAVRDGPAEA